MTSSLLGNAMSGSSNGLPQSAPRRTGNSTQGQRPTVHSVRSAKGHWFISLSVFLALLGCGGFVLSKKAKPAYEAHSLVYISPKVPKILENDNEVDLPYDSYFADQIQKPTRYDIIQDAITQLPYAVRHLS